jgi:hypothetical protein
MLSLYPHQEKAINDLSNGKILYGDVGTGKSRTAVGYYLKKEAPKDVYVITTAKKRDSLDWEGEFLRGHVSKLERSPDGKRGKLWVDSWNNIANYKNVRGAFFIFDEQRLVGSGAWCKAFEFIAKNNNWILLTGTPGDTWLDYMSVFIANGFYRNRTQFKDEHVVYSTYVKFPKVERYMNEHKLEKLRKELLVHMPMEKHTTRVTHYIPVEYDQELLDKVDRERWNPYLDRPIRSLAEYFYVRRKVIYSHPSRLEAVRYKLTQHPKLIVYYNFDYELEILRKLADEVPTAEWNGHKHEEIPDTDRWVYLVQYTSGAEGWNCITTDTTLFYSLTYSYRTWKQAHGRTDRLNTPFSVLHYLVLLATFSATSATSSKKDLEMCVVDASVLASLKAKKDFNERSFAQKNRLPSFSRKPAN